MFGILIITGMVLFILFLDITNKSRYSPKKKAVLKNQKTDTQKPYTPIHQTGDKEIMGTIISLLSWPILILNLVGGITGGIWLLISGEWPLVIISLILVLVSEKIIGILSLPAMFLLGAGINTEKQNGFFVALLGTLYITALRIVWCLVILNRFTAMQDRSTSIIPVLLLSYSVATAPWQDMAIKDINNPHSILSSFFTQIAFVVAMFMYGFEAGFKTIAVVFSITVAFIALMQIIFALHEEMLLKSSDNQTGG
ncbi:MAG: hypothetical protein LBQ14_01840 [Treponema sp.]|jgi:hypothetical protein|nr:hypothetical protein [Treponema sp.]